MPSQASKWRGIFLSQTLSISSISSSQHRCLRPHISNSEDESPKPSVKVLKTKDYTNISRLAECDHLMDNNWHEWKDWMLRVFYSSDIAEYVSGFKKHPDPSIDPIGAVNWDKNDVWAQQVIINNVTTLQMNHIGSKQTSHAMYSVLSDTHNNRAHLMVTHLQQLIYDTKASEGTTTPNTSICLSPTAIVSTNSPTRNFTCMI
jgi:hypothetical protein